MIIELDDKTMNGANHIPYGRHYIDDDDIDAVVKLLRSGSLTQGDMVECFEKAVAEYVGCKYAVAVSSGTAGLHLAALAAGVGKGSKLITSPISFVASANASLFTGGEIAFADISRDTQNICVSSLEEVIKNNPDTKAIMPVHFAGLPCDMPEIKRIADAASAAVIEDAAHALGSRYADGQRVGCCSHSLMTVFSFHPVKVIAAGEGGMITTNDEVVYRRLIRLRSHGINKLDDALVSQIHPDKIAPVKPWYYEMQELGFNYRLTEIQCALANSQLQKIEKFIEKRRDLVLRYDEAFKDMKCFRPAQLSGRSKSAHHLYVLQVDFAELNLSRTSVMLELKRRNIGTQVHYIPIPSHPYYQSLGHKVDDFPNAKRFYQNALSIPLFYSLSYDQQQYVISQFKELLC